MNWVLRPFGFSWASKEEAAKYIYISDEEQLARETEELERENPNWDRASRIDSVLSVLDQGMDPEMVRGIYGDDIYFEALMQASREDHGARIVHPSLVPAEARRPAARTASDAAMSDPAAPNAPLDPAPTDPAKH